MKKQASAPSRRFTVLDVVILVALLLIVAIALYFVFFSGSAEVPATEPTVPIAYTVECKNLADEFVGNVKVGDIVIDSVTKKTIGVVSAVENMPYTQFAVNYEADALEEKEYPGRSNLLITISVDANVGPLGYHVNGYRLAIGVPHYLQLPHFVSEGYCISVQEQN